MAPVRLALLLVADAFILFTVYVVWSMGGLGPTFATVGHNLATVQLSLDLVLALLGAAMLIGIDARRAGINPWPYIAACFLTGSPGVLLYLWRRLRPAA